MYYPVSKPSITKKEIYFVNEAMNSGWVSSLGPYIDKFEKLFADYCEVDYALTTSNGTTGLHLALEVLKIGFGDEVIIPDLTFIATANSVAYTGAKPVIVDIDPYTLCIDSNEIIKAITPKTKAIIAVHLYGHPCDMNAINIVAKEYNLKVIEDAAEAHGAKYLGSRVGGLSDIAVFSFYGNKIITTGEGGMITTNNKELYEYAKLLRDHAMSPVKRYFHSEKGYNYRMTNIQAALGVAQMERIDEIVDHRRRLMNWYREYIVNSENISLNRVAEWADSTFWMICLEIKTLTVEQKMSIMNNLRNEGIDTRPYFLTITSMPMYRSNKQNPISLNKSIIGMNLPTYYELQIEDINYICNCINQQIKTVSK